MERLEQVEIFHFHMPHHGTTYNTATETTFTIGGARDSCNLPSDRFNVQFRLRHGSRTHNNLAGDAHHLSIFHVRPPNTPTITDVDLCHKKAGRPWFNETRVIRYQPFVSVHNVPFHSECYTIDKGRNKTCEYSIIFPTNIQYLKIHVCN
jgi:hypothetical protein